jgi:alkanesulfonate monooxygenase SsuD/methylene tetrahydromethanopterin reductase-like flavin-dependent oxidoreductase (luciferase family)
VPDTGPVWRDLLDCARQKPSRRSACPIPRRDPIQTAWLVASIDRISGERFLFGVGDRWNRAEIENHGAVFKTRQQMARKSIEAMMDNLDGAGVAGAARRDRATFPLTA